MSPQYIQLKNKFIDLSLNDIVFVQINSLRKVKTEYPITKGTQR